MLRSLLLRWSFALGLAAVPWCWTLVRQSAPASQPVPPSQEELLHQILDLRAVLVENGREPESSEATHLWSVRLARAVIEATPDRTVAALEDHCNRMKERARRARDLQSSGRGTRVEALIAAYFEAEAEAWLKRKSMR